MSTFVRSKNIPYNLTYQIMTPDGIYKNTEHIYTRKQYLLKPDTVAKIALVTSLLVDGGNSAQQQQEITFVYVSHYREGNYRYHTIQNL